MEQHNKLSIFVLEDSCERLRAFSDAFVNDRMVVTNCAETAILFLNSHKFDYIFLDHDLGGEVYVDINRKDTGSEVCREINDLNKDSQFIIHSWNINGAENMKMTLGGKGFTRVVKQMFNEDMINDIKGQLK